MATPSTRGDGARPFDPRGRAAIRARAERGAAAFGRRADVRMRRRAGVRLARPLRLGLRGGGLCLSLGAARGFSRIRLRSGLFCGRLFCRLFLQASWRRRAWPSCSAAALPARLADFLAAAFFDFLRLVVAIRTAGSARRAERLRGAGSSGRRRVDRRCEQRLRRCGGLRRRCLLRSGFLFRRGLLRSLGGLLGGLLRGLLRRSLAFFGATFFAPFFFFSGAAFFAFFLLFDFLAFFAMMVLLAVRTIILRRSRAIEKPLHLRPRRILREQCDSSRLIHTIMCASAAGCGPPCAQSRSSTVCTTGIAVAPAICVMQPMFPVAITSAPVRSMFATLRSRRRAAISGCMML